MIPLWKESLENGKLSEIMAFPFENGEDYDLDAVEKVISQKYDDAMVIEDDVEEKQNSTIAISWIRIIIGAVFVVVAIAGITLLLILFNKKNKMYK